MKWFIVSEEELEEMILVAIAQGRCGLGYKPKKDFLEAKAACRARSVKPSKLYNPRDGSVILCWELIES